MTRLCTFLPDDLTICVQAYFDLAQAKHAMGPHAITSTQYDNRMRPLVAVHLCVATVV